MYLCFCILDRLYVMRRPPRQTLYSGGKAPIRQATPPEEKSTTPSGYACHPSGGGELMHGELLLEGGR